MSDAKGEYALAVIEIKSRALADEALAESIQNSYLERRRFVRSWMSVNINDVVAEIAPGSHATIEGRKVYFRNAEGTMAVIADVSGYLRVAVLPAEPGERYDYRDLHGRDVHNYTDVNGKQHGRSKADFNSYTHYRIKHRDEM